jgi:hypothetical protein
MANHWFAMCIHCDDGVLWWIKIFFTKGSSIKRHLFSMSRRNAAQRRSATE